MKKIYQILIGLVMLAVGLSVGYFWGFSNEQAVLNSKLNTIQPIREHNSGYKFVDPLLAYIIPSADQESQLVSLRDKIKDAIEANKKNSGFSNASMFFYDLNRSRWIGVNESEKYNPASMLKVVIMMAYLKESETNPAILNNYLVYSKEADSFVKQDVFNSSSSLKVGSSYRVDDLIKKMIIDSDNGAAGLLLFSANPNSLDSIYSAFNITNPSETDNFTISPRVYSLFFRILYSSTYLNNADSEKALEIFSQTNFNDGLVAGLPQNIKVAHKFGEYVSGQNGQPQEIELHDCGIVYYPNSPYLLCVMTVGSNLDVLKNTVKEISSLVYQNYSNSK